MTHFRTFLCQWLRRMERKTLLKTRRQHQEYSFHLMISTLWLKATWSTAILVTKFQLNTKWNFCSSWMMNQTQAPNKRVGRTKHTGDFLRMYEMPSTLQRRKAHTASSGTSCKTWTTNWWSIGNSFTARCQPTWRLTTRRKSWLTTPRLYRTTKRWRKKCKNNNWNK